MIPDFWSELRNPTDTYTSSLLLITISFALGFTPYSLEGGVGERRLQYRKIGLFNTLCHITIFIVCYALSFASHESILEIFFQSDISKAADLIQKVVGFIGMPLLFWTSYLNRTAFSKAYRLLFELDGHFLDFGEMFDYKKALRCSYIVVIVTTATNFIFFAYSTWMFVNNDLIPSLITFIVFFQPAWFLSFMVFSYNGMVSRIQFRIYAMNKVSRKNPTQSDKNLLHVMIPNFWRELVNPSDAYASVIALFAVSFLFGLTPFRLEGPKGARKLKVIALGLINALFHIVMFTYFYVYCFIHNESILQHFFQTDVSKLADFLIKIVGIIGMPTLFITCYSRRNIMIKLIHQIGFIDEKLVIFGYDFQYRRFMWFSALWTCIALGANFAFIGYSWWLFQSYDTTPSYAAFASFFEPNIFFAVVLTLFYGFCLRLSRRLGIVNEVLKNLVHQWDNKKNNKINTITTKSRSFNMESFSMFTIASKSHSDIIQQSMEIHQLLCEAASIANKYFTYQLLTIISISFLIIVFDAYYVLETLLGKSKRENKFKTVEFVTFFSCQMFLYTIAIISIVEGSSRAINKSEKTAGIVHKLLNKATTPELKEKLQQFSMQLVHLKVQFTAAGLFNIDRTLYFTICGAVTTYLIILLQFTNQNTGQPFASTQPPS
ncbi:hypothetical protein ACFFRR_004130 [Megaselia abdita]